MHIGIIGAGSEGAALARNLVAANHEVAIANAHGPDTLRPLVQTLGRRAAAATPREAARFGDVVMLATPFRAYESLAPEDFAGKVVVDAENYYPRRDGPLPELDNDDTTSSELVQQHLPGARLVKAFNAMQAGHLTDYGRSAGAGQRYGIPVCGDDDAAKRIVMDLVEQMGFEPVDAGSLADGGRRIQPGSPVFTADLPAEELHARFDPTSG